MQQLVARDGGFAGRDGGDGGGTDRGAVLGSGGAKEVAQPGGDLAVGRGGGGGVVSEPWHWDEGWWCCCGRAALGECTVWRRSPSAARFAICEPPLWWPPVLGMPSDAVVRKADKADSTRTVLRPIERTLREASGRDEACASLSVPCRGDTVWRCTGWPGQPGPGRGGAAWPAGSRVRAAPWDGITLLIISQHAHK